MQKDFEKQKERPSGGKFLGFDHCHFWVGNAKQAASFYTSRFGFEYYAYKGLETQCRDVATHVVRSPNSGVILAFSSPYTEKGVDINEGLAKHGDGVKDVAFRVENATDIYNKAISRGAVSISPPKTLKDENGSVIIATIKTYGDTWHSFVQRVDFNGVFLPGFIPHPLRDPINKLIPQTEFQFIDHVVGNQPDLQMTPVAEFYENTLDFHRFWSVDDSIMHTEYSALRSIVVADFDENVKMPINEPAKGKRKSQIQEYVDYYAGAGVQHIALNTKDCIKTVENMRSRGTDFLEVPISYYDRLRKNIPHMTIKIDEDIDLLQKNRILVDYDEKGYLLQLFTKPVQDRPTLFFEVIQRHNNSGFGAGNFKSLFEAIEDEQNRRGNLIDDTKEGFKY